MSLLEVVETQVFGADFTLTAGAIAPAVNANFNGASKLLSIVRKTAGGTVGIPKCSVTQPSGAGSATAVYLLGVYSSSATDTSVYTVYWTNQYIPSTNFLQSGATAGVQFTP
jgi:hypothetical protein